MKVFCLLFFKFCDHSKGFFSHFFLILLYSWIFKFFLDMILALFYDCLKVPLFFYLLGEFLDRILFWKYEKLFWNFLYVALNIATLVLMFLLFSISLLSFFKMKILEKKSDLIFLHFSFSLPFYFLILILFFLFLFCFLIWEVVFLNFQKFLSLYGCLSFVFLFLKA